MTQAILLLDYEPRTAVRVTEALAPLGCQIVTARDVDGAVAACAKVEPQVVLTTSVLPRLKVEDAITQLRALAGLRNTPFLVLMSGYSGQDPHADAAKLGAQDIIAKPFSNDELLEHVRGLLSRPRSAAGSSTDTRAEVLEALRRAGGSRTTGTVTSKDLFGDLLAEEPGAKPTAAAGQARPSAPAAAAQPPRTARVLPDADAVVEQALAGTLAELQKTPARPAKARRDTGQVSVEKLLEDTLSGLDIRGTHKPAGTPPAAPPSEPFAAPVEHPPEALEPFPEPEPGPPSELGIGEGEPAPAPLPSGTPFGQYELIAPIATGGMAEVYRARMRGVEGFQKIVAIKRILPHLTDNDEFLSMFVDEAKLAAQLQHPNIIHIYDLGKIERSYYLAMEYIDGRDLRSILQTLEEKRARLPLGLTLFIASRLAAALDYAHRKHDLQGRAMGLVHRDVSPQNVLISYDGDIKLCDFGIVKAASKASHTRAGALKGKLQYMSPEQAWGKDLDRRSDIYSLGLVLYEMLTGRKPFAGDSELSILEQVRSPHLIPPRELDPAIPPEVERVAMKALREDREERFQTAGELAADLGNMLQVIRPTPGASDLGAFLAELVGHERTVGGQPVPTPRPAITPPLPITPPAPAAPPLHPAEAARPKPAPPAEHPYGDIPAVLTEPRRSRVGLLVGIGAVAVAIVAGAVYLTRSRGPATDTMAEGTPAPETVEMTRSAAEQEVARQTEALRERLSAQPQSPIAAPAQPPATTPQARTATAPTPAARQVQAAPPPTAPVVPTEAPTEVPTAAAPAAEPTLAPPPPTVAAPVEQPTAAAPPVEVPAAREGDLVEMGAGVVGPQAIYSPKPAYPPLAERQRVSGTVFLDVLVDENGSVQDVRLLRGPSPDFGLNAAAAGAVRAWRYKPATKGGVKVKIRITQPIVFKLTNP